MIGGHAIRNGPLQKKIPPIHAFEGLTTLFNWPLFNDCILSSGDRLSTRRTARKPYKSHKYRRDTRLRSWTQPGAFMPRFNRVYRFKLHEHMIVPIGISRPKTQLTGPTALQSTCIVTT